IYTKYWQDALELWVLDRNTHQTRQLTQNGAVKVEPRFSPDGSRIVFVSTSFHAHFHIFVAKFADGALQDVQQLTGQTHSDLPRYYYSAIDHEISPAWSPDGREIVYVSNRGHIYGTGGFWRMAATPGAAAREFHYEETTWRARPEFSPDGSRLVYASYLGQQWHQLWLMPAAGGNAFPIGYGDYDNGSPRWSPDGKQIAFISNRSGNLSLWVQAAWGGAQREITATDRKYLAPVGVLRIKVLDEHGRVTAARLSVTASDARAFGPDNGWMRADDSFVRGERATEQHYFHTSGTVDVTAPAGIAVIEAMKGFTYQPLKQRAGVCTGSPTEITLRLKRLSLPEQAGARWVSGDVHVHMNYAGVYRDTPERLVAQAAAEDLNIVENLIVNKEQRIPDISYFSPQPDAASSKDVLLLHSQEFHTSYWGHLGLLNLTENFLLPGYAGYPGTAAASLYPMNADVADLAHAQHALVGYVHPFDELPDPANDSALSDELPVDVALRKVDYMEVLGFSDHKASTDVWYKLLNCGFDLPAAAGTDAMANFASLRGPVGLNRVYARVASGPLKHANWLRSLQQGHTFATNGPLLGFRLRDAGPGDTLKLPGATSVRFHAWLRSMVKIHHLQIVCNGSTVRELPLPADGLSADIAADLPVASAGWCLLRAVSDHPEWPILDQFPYATTSAIRIGMKGRPWDNTAEADYFLAWIDRLITNATANSNWNTVQEKQHVLEVLANARGIFQQLKMSSH
ncbi:MAG: CehA/McbA family metallohydrolase, partial [Acidobacteriales bacterium]|nr:CehA/McbA family metallohydrolase [Terriglobales bacterium]